MIGKAFIKNSAIYTLAGALPMLSALLLLPFYVKYLPAESYGAFAICLAISSLAQVITTYSFDSSLYIHYHEFKNDKVKLSQMVGASFTFMLVLGGCITVASLILGQVLFSFFVKTSTLNFFPNGLMAVALGAFQAIFKVHGNLLQTRERSVPFLVSNIVVFAIIATTSIIGLIIFPNSLIGPLGGRLFAFGILAFWALKKVYSEFGFHADSPWVAISKKFNAYTFVYQLQQWVTNYFDRFIILLFMPSAAMATVGIYDFAVKCLVPIELLLNGLNATIFPKIIPLISSQKGEKRSTPEINRYFYGQVSVIMLVVSVAILVYPYAFNFFDLGEGFGEALKWIPYLAPLFILKSIRLYFVIPLNTLKFSKELTLISLSVSFFKVGLMYIAIFSLGIEGIILTSGLAFCVELVMLWIVLKSRYQIVFNFFKLIIGPGTMVVLILIFESGRFVSHPNLAHMLLVVMCFFVIAFAYRNELRYLGKLLDRLK